MERVLKEELEKQGSEKEGSEKEESEDSEAMRHLLGKNEMRRWQELKNYQKLTTKDYRKPKKRKAKMKKETAEVLANGPALAEEDKRKLIRFKDPIGRGFSFPFHLCARWEASTYLSSQINKN